MSPIVLIGPSGSGKSTLAQLVTQRLGLMLIKTYTTRSQRSNDDDSHVFVSTEQFSELYQKNAFIGTIDIFGASYGLPLLPKDRRCLLLLRAPVLVEFKKSYPDSVVIEIDAPVALLKKRLVARQSLDRIDEGLLQKEMSAGRQLADFRIDTSRPIEDCYRELVDILSKV